MGGDGTLDDHATRRSAVLEARRAAVDAAADPEELGLAYRRLAATLHDMGQSHDALRSAARALKTYSGLRDPSGWVAVVRLIASIHLAMGDEERALEILIESRQEVVTRQPRPATLAELDAATAEVLRALGRPNDALGVLERARTVFEAEGVEEIRPTMDHDLAVLIADLGEGEAALSLLQRAREGFLARRDRLGVASASHNLGCLLHDLGSLDDAVEYLQEARGIFLALDAPEDAAACDQNLGVVLHDMGRSEDAGRRLAVARHRFAKAGMPRSAAECDFNLSVVLDALGHHDEARTYEARAREAGVVAPVADAPAPPNQAERTS